MAHAYSAFGVLAVLGAAAALGACNESGGAAVTVAPFGLTSANLEAATSLTKAERDQSIATCIARRSKIHKLNVRGGRVDGAQLQRMNQQLAAAFPKFCDCFVNRLEDKTTRLQFAMAMTLIEHGEAGNEAKAAPALSDLKKAALRLGQRTEDYEQSRRDVPALAKASVEGCADHLEPSG
jgi:hypothetical protein